MVNRSENDPLLILRFGMGFCILIILGLSLIL